MLCQEGKYVIKRRTVQKVSYSHLPNGERIYLPASALQWLEVVKRDINTSVLWGTIACRLSRVPGCWRRPRGKNTEEQDFIQEEGWCQESSIWAPIGRLCTVAVADVRGGQGGVIVVVVVVQLLKRVSLFVIP